MCTCRCQPPGLRSTVHGVVEVARRFAVNRDDRQLPKVAPAARAASPAACATFSASASTSAGNSCGKWCLRIMISTSTPNSPGRPRISIHAPRRHQAAGRETQDLHIHHRAIELRHWRREVCGKCPAEVCSADRAGSSSPGGITISGRCAVRTAHAIVARSVAKLLPPRGVRPPHHTKDVPFGALPPPSRRLRRGPAPCRRASRPL